jgi:cytochrome c oxidase cbb3-type subunit 3
MWGGSLDQIYQTIQHGVRNADEKSRQTNMPRFGVDGLLTSSQIDSVTDYVLSLSGQGKATPEGAKIFQEQCAACHKADGKGNQEMGAPNLTDGIWLYGGDRNSVYRSIFYARNGSMPAWGQRLDDATLKMLAVYVHSLGGGK